MRRTLCSIAIVSLGGWLAACSDKGDATADPAADAAATEGGDSATVKAVAFSAEQVTHGGVQWSAVRTTTISSGVELPGQLVPNEDRTARLGAPAQGRVITVHVRPGERVGVGQALVTLQSEAGNSAAADVAKASAEVAARRAAATFARTARERADRLLAIKAASRQEAERAAADDRLAQAAVIQAETELQRAEARMAQLGATSVGGNIVVRSPIAGVVLNREASSGVVVDAGALLVTVSDPSSLWLELSATDRAAATIRAGASVRFVVPAFPTDTFTAIVQSVGHALDSDTRMIPVRARVQNNSGRLRPAMFATTWVDNGSQEQAVVVPDSAVQLLDKRPVVFIAQPDGSGGARFERRNVEVGGTAGGQTRIVGGLAAGDMVVTSGAYAIKSEFARAKMAVD